MAYEEFGNLFKKFRENTRCSNQPTTPTGQMRKGLTQDYLAELLHVKKNTIANWETQERRPEDRDLLVNAIKIMAGMHKSCIADYGKRGITNPEEANRLLVLAEYLPLSDDEIRDIFGLDQPLRYLPIMVSIPAGEFWMGSDSRDNAARENEKTGRHLTLPHYFLAKTPVTNAEYEAFIQATDHKPPRLWKGKHPPSDKENHPVVEVNWYDALAYCRWLTNETGYLYRLPSEAEWEKGARGNDGRIYPWGDRWETNKCNSGEDGRVCTTPVDTYPAGASPYGLLDMAGNVWEWTRNVFRPYPFCIEEDDEKDKRMLAKELRVALGESDPYTEIQEDVRSRANLKRALRGGAYLNVAWSVRCAVRISNDPNTKSPTFGFRVMKEG